MNVDWNIYVFIKVETNHPLPAKTELSSHRIKILIFYTESGWYIIFLETIYNILIGWFFFRPRSKKTPPTVLYSRKFMVYCINMEESNRPSNK